MKHSEATSKENIDLPLINISYIIDHVGTPEEQDFNPKLKVHNLKWTKNKNIILQKKKQEVELEIKLWYSYTQLRYEYIKPRYSLSYRTIYKGEEGYINIFRPIGCWTPEEVVTRIKKLQEDFNKKKLDGMRDRIKHYED